MVLGCICKGMDDGDETFSMFIKFCSFFYIDWCWKPSPRESLAFPFARFARVVWTLFLGESIWRHHANPRKSKSEIKFAFASFEG
jgi:hypothetical protein